MSYSVQSAMATLHGAEWIPITAVRILIGVFFSISGGAGQTVCTGSVQDDGTNVGGIAHSVFACHCDLRVARRVHLRHWPGARPAFAPLCAIAPRQHDRRQRG